MGKIGKFGLKVSAAVLAAASLSSSAWAGSWLEDTLAAGKPIVDVRLRYEGVSDDNCATCAGQDASAKTLRARLGYQTGKWNGLSLTFAFDQIWALGSEDYNSKSNGHTAYPVVADPAVTALDRLSLSYDGLADTTITAGRQPIILGNARFIGNVGFRQHEQTFDAVSVVNTSLPDTKLTYAWIGGVNRVFGPDSKSGAAIGHYISDSHIFNAVYSGLPEVKLEGYIYLLDLKEAPAASTASYGFSGDWQHKLGALTAKLGGAYAYQAGYGSNPNSIGLSYWNLDGQLSYDGLAAGLGYEVMQGNGTVGFATPLATLHAFDGWADLFLATPKDGIDDLSAHVSYTFKDAFDIVTLVPMVVYHSFAADRTGAGIGGEWDLSLNMVFTKQFSLNASYAAYGGAGIAAGGFKDKSITWLTASFQY